MQERAQSILYNTNALDSLLFVSPQPYQDPSRVREDCVCLFENIQSLIPVRGHLRMSLLLVFQLLTWHSEKGTRTVPLVFLAGTVPITFKGSQYNIPCVCFLIQ